MTSPARVPTRNSSGCSVSLRAMSACGSFHGRVNPHSCHRAMTAVSSPGRKARIWMKAILYLDKQVEHAIQPGVIERVRRMLAHDRLGPIGDRNARNRHHRNVVRAVADRDGLLPGDAEPIDLRTQPGRLGSAVDDSADHAPGETPALDLQL